jgi:hypothetical protein
MLESDCELWRVADEDEVEGAGAMAGGDRRVLVETERGAIG